MVSAVCPGCHRRKIVVYAPSSPQIRRHRTGTYRDTDRSICPGSGRRATVTTPVPAT